MERASYLYEKMCKEGEPAVDELIISRKSEELFLDFKSSADQGSGNKLHQGDRNNLAKAISGFGNSEGGIIIWGVNCSKSDQEGDIARSKVPIQNVSRFLSWMEGAVSSCTIPPHTRVEHRIVGQDSQGAGYIVSFIPKSMSAPHQTIFDMKYYIRAGSSFVPTPHAVLAGMFGRRPQPNVFHSFLSHTPKLVGAEIICPISFIIHNAGPGVASDLFLNLSIISSPGENCNIGSDNYDSKWMVTVFLQQKINLISKPYIRIAPEQELMPITLNLSLNPPFIRELHIKGICGCGQSPPYRFSIKCDHKTIDILYKDFLAKTKQAMMGQKDLNHFRELLWAIFTEEKE